ncbi:bifunctional 2-polyprenyl-6-hydroxyphenol methylase/3-demethylubiquinol 3-O-methyltransferase UbiG [Pseudomonas sp. NBRC 111119]|uniref:class I SAM-dependent methyltransferase n=1 Tax=Pseudomonas sp. NBRC 111119 TaxID=1661034 RepID=UPI00076190C3|nr:class I SAM-dependent methyltransferase [Pseudomonas sp. NBRC 111119]
MSAGFYRAFEDRYRGSRELITQRLQAYLPFLEPLKALYADYPVLDLGCGRGEWLELMLREGFMPLGVDLDEGMLEACQARKLPAHKDDVLNALRKLPDNSQVVVSGFHIAEHLPFELLQELVAEALRVLRPAGLLILETPNAENVTVGTNNFFLDPTHQQPLPHLLMTFLAEHSGFARAKAVRLQEAPELHDEQAPLGVLNVLFGVSPDYAVVAQKAAEASQLQPFDGVFEAAYGISLDQLAHRYDRAVDRRFADLQGSVEEVRATFLAPAEFQKIMAEAQAQQTHQLLVIQDRYQTALSDVQLQLGAMQSEHTTLQQQLAGMQVERNVALENCHHHYLRAQAAEQQIQVLLASTSWRVTAPLRLIGRVLRWPTQHGKASLRRAAPHARLWVARRPAVKRLALAVLRRSPWLDQQLRRLLATEAAAAADPQHGVIDHAPLTPRGRSIESALGEAMNKSKN